MDLFENTPAGKVNIAELSAGKKVVVFGVPGAFTPGCSKVNIALMLMHYYETKPYLQKNFSW